jgi:putative tricarboxylic transport membrane protein
MGIDIMMKNINGRVLQYLFVSLLTVSLPCVAWSEVKGQKQPPDYPKKPITIIVPLAPGGTSDIGYRLLQPYLAKELGGDVMVENKPGASGQIGLSEGLRKPADGYTVMHVHQTLTSSSILLQKAPYTVNDFAIINTLHSDPECVAVKKDAPYNNLGDLLDYIKAHPGKLSMSVSRGSSCFIMFNWIKDKLKYDFNIVPFDSAQPARVACLGGHTDFVGTSVADIYTDIDSLKAIAVGGDMECSLYPGVKTVGEQLKPYGVSPSSVPSMPSWRSIAFKASFKKEYPERWNFFVGAYKRAYYNPEHLASAKKANLSGIMHICDTPEDAQQEFLRIHKTMESFSAYLKR